MSRLEHLKFSSGERYSMLLDDEGMPDFWLTLFVTVEVRPGGSQSTIASYITDIRHFMLWEEIQGRNVFTEFYNLKFLDEHDCQLLRDHCLLRVSDIKAWKEIRTKQTVRSISKDFPSVPRTLERVSGEHARNRMSRIAEYLAFVARAMLRRRPNVQEINEDIEAMKMRLHSYKPKASGRKGFATDPDSKAPALKVFNEFLAAVQFDAENNPFKSSQAKKRNALIFNILEATGVRASELLALKLDDIDYQQNLIRIERRHDDKDDPRKKQPVVKTLSRDIPVSRDLIKQVLGYIQNERAETHGANKHPYLIVVHHKGQFVGTPMSNSGFEKVVKNAVLKLGKAADSYKDEELIREITRHGFRHNFNYRLSKAFDKRNALAKIDKSIKALSEREQNQIRMQLNGWESEDTAANYNLRHIKEEARKVMLEDMQEKSSKIVIKRD